MKRPKRLRDPSQLAKLIVGIATGEIEEKQPRPGDHIKGRAGGLKGGVIRAKKLSPAKRIRIAKKAAQARWRKKPVTT